MIHRAIHDNKEAGCNSKRSGATIAVVAVSLTALMGFLALGIDLGLVYTAKAELQRAADATALACAWELLDQDRLRGDYYRDEVFAAARESASAIAAENPLLGASTIVDGDEDVVIGFLADPSDPDEALSAADPDAANAAEITVRRDSERGGSISLFFGQLFGASSKDLSTEAVASFSDKIDGFRVDEDSGNTAGLLPFTLIDSAWDGLLTELDAGCTADNYMRNGDGTVSNGTDGLCEINLYPGAGADQLPPGNFGTVDICNPNNSTADISDQILNGIDADNMSHCIPAGELVLGADGEVDLQGDTGLSAAIKDELEAIKGDPRGIPIFNSVALNGNNTTYTITKFGCVSIMYVKLTGAMAQKKVIVQPATCVDSTAFDDPGAGASDYVYTPPKLVR